MRNYTYKTVIYNVLFWLGCFCAVYLSAILFWLVVTGFQIVLEGGK
jgi:hypothetical protein